jgi:hypothetical protein
MDPVMARFILAFRHPKEKIMKKRSKFLLPITVLLAIPAVLAQTPANEHNCNFKDAFGNPAPAAIPPFVGTGHDGFSPNQNLCLPQLAPTPTGLSPLAFIVQGVEPGDRVDSQGSIYVVSIRGVPGGIDLWRWYQPIDVGPNADGTIPFKYEGQPDNCGIFAFSPVPGMGGCANNVGSAGNLGVAPGGGDADIAVNAPDPLNSSIPNLAVTSLSLVPGVTATHSTNRADNFFPPNTFAAAISGDDREWQDAIGSSTVYLNYHDVATFNINVQRSSDGGETYINGLGEAIDPQTVPAAGTPVGAANVAGQIRIDHGSCPSGGNLYQIFVAPDNATENVTGAPLRTVYVGVSNTAKMGLPAFLFTDHKIFTSPLGSPGAINGTNQVFPAMATDAFGFVYAVWSDNTNIFFSSSSDLGTTWTTPIRVNSGKTVGNANVFPWVAADANGHAVVVWLGDNLVGNSNDRTVLEKTCSDGTNSCWAKWNVYAAETVSGHDLVPAFTQFIASDHVIHSGTVSTGGLGGGADRNLADFFQVALDPQHRANISFADDHIHSPLCTSQSPGHCADNDPQSFRTGQPYFTYHLKANPNIVTIGTCAPAPPPSGAEKITGGGQIPSVKPGLSANFGFVAKSPPPNAALSYHDDGAPGGSIDVHSTNTSVPAVTFTGNCGSSKGDAKVNQQLGYTYAAEACDNGGTGKDTFSISVTGLNFSYANSGTLTSGNIQIHSE